MEKLSKQQTKFLAVVAQAKERLLKRVGSGYAQLTFGMEAKGRIPITDEVMSNAITPLKWKYNYGNLVIFLDELVKAKNAE